MPKGLQQILEGQSSHTLQTLFLQLNFAKQCATPLPLRRTCLIEWSTKPCSNALVSSTNDPWRDRSVSLLRRSVTGNPTQTHPLYFLFPCWYQCFFTSQELNLLWVGYWREKAARSPEEPAMVSPENHTTTSNALRRRKGTIRVGLGPTLSWWLPMLNRSSHWLITSLMCIPPLLEQSQRVTHNN
jgi:hypothetical protein